MNRVVAVGAAASVLAAMLASTSASARTVGREQAAAMAWGPVVTLSTRPALSRPDVVVGGRGVTTVVWSEGGRVRAARQAPGAPWRYSWLGHGSGPAVDIAQDGSVTVIWSRRRDGFGPQVMSTTRSPGGGWPDPQPVSPAISNEISTARGAFEPTVAVNGGGAAVVSWLRSMEDSGAARVQARFRSADSDQWSPVSTLSPVEAYDPSVAIDDAGRAVVVYTIAGREYAVRRAGGAWGTPVKIGEHGGPAQVVADSAGSVVVSWMHSTDAGRWPEGASRPVGGPWQAPEILDPPGVQSPATGTPVVAMSDSGRATVAWTRVDGSVMRSDRPEGGSWSPPREVAPPGDDVLVLRPFMDMTSAGAETVLAWTRRDAGVHRIEAAQRGAGGWSEPETVSPAGDCAAAETDLGPGGLVAAVWRCETADGREVQIRRWTPPV